MPIRSGNIDITCTSGAERLRHAPSPHVLPATAATTSRMRRLDRHARTFDRASSQGGIPNDVVADRVGAEAADRAGRRARARGRPLAPKALGGCQSAANVCAKPTRAASIDRARYRSRSAPGSFLARSMWPRGPLVRQRHGEPQAMVARAALTRARRVAGLGLRWKGSPRRVPPGFRDDTTRQPCFLFRLPHRLERVRVAQGSCARRSRRRSTAVERKAFTRAEALVRGSPLERGDRRIRRPTVCPAPVDRSPSPARAPARMARAQRARARTSRRTPRRARDVVTASTRCSRTST